MKKSNILEQPHYKTAALTCRALNHPFRLKILQSLHIDQEQNVQKLHRYFGVEQSVMSQHLAVLRAAGVVTARKENKQVFYSLNKDALARINEAILSLNN